MKGKQFALILVWCFVNSAIADNQGATLSAGPKADEGDDEREVMEFPQLIEVSAEELSRIEKEIGSELKPNSRGLFKSLVENLVIEKSNGLVDDIRVIVFKVQLEYLSKIVFADRMNIREYVNADYACHPDPKNSAKLPISKFNYLHVKELLTLHSQFRTIFIKWFQAKGDKLSRVAQPNSPIESATLGEIKESINDLGAKLEPFFEKFIAYRKDLVPHLQNRLCNMKNFMNFFQILPRFHKIYKQIPDGFTKDYRYMDMLELKKKFNEVYFLYMIPFLTLSVVSNVIREYQFYINKEQNAEVIRKAQTFILSISESLGRFSTRLCHFSTKVLAITVDLENAVKMLEDAADIKSPKFPDIGVIQCSALRVIVSGLLIMLALIFS